MVSPIIIFFAIVAAASAASVSQPHGEKWRNAPPGRRVSINGKEYIFGDVDSNGSLTDAHNYCNTRNMVVLAFDTENEFEQVRQYIQTEASQQNMTAYWTSGMRASDSDTWYWSSNHQTFDPSLAHWGPGSPRQPLTWDACVAIVGPTFDWVDELLGMCEFGYIRHFICEEL
ncbi:Hypothetical predicted protein [Cloeon dipterum]|uniref:C-type lectin domain-containing protein n=1 Tax=Cloeon dipterum TaxID=197152 RepID=A0A8S1E4C4_9INSE|nr:Hypothetical predicted protein [Cloeon dipterum]